MSCSKYAGIIALLIASGAPQNAHSEETNLEDAIIGTYTASGRITQAPGGQAERIFCRLVGEKKEADKFSFFGRCATGNKSGRLALDLTVLEVGRKYRLQVRVMAKKQDTNEQRFHYAGTADGNLAQFITRFSDNGRSYQSLMKLQFSSDGIQSIQETVTDLETSKESNLLALKVKQK